MRIAKHVVLLVIASANLVGVNAEASDYLCKTVSNDWVWFDDHAASIFAYTAVGSTHRIYETGTGIFLSGKPRGSIEWSGVVRFTAWGFGALHIRQADSGGAFQSMRDSEEH